MISSNVSRKTLNQLDKIVDNYKIRVLDDINSHFEINMDKQEFRDIFLKRKLTKINRKNTPIDYDKCFAVVYSKEFGYNQCKKSKCEENYCNLHAKNRFYGSIDLNNCEPNT
jgi:hypothetical protein